MEHELSENSKSAELNSDMKLLILDYLYKAVKGWGLFIGITNVSIFLIALLYLFFVIQDKAINEIKSQAVLDIKVQIESQIKNAIQNLNSQLHKTLIEFGEAKNRLENLKNESTLFGKSIEHAKKNSTAIAQELNDIEETVKHRTKEFFELNNKVKASLGIVETDIAQLNGKIETIKKNIKDNDSVSKELNKRISNHQIAIENEENNIESLDSRIELVDKNVKLIEHSMKQSNIEPIANLIKMLDKSPEVKTFLIKFSDYETKTTSIISSLKKEIEKLATIDMLSDLKDNFDKSFTKTESESNEMAEIIASIINNKRLSFKLSSKINILIFNACKNNSAHNQLKDIMSNVFPDANIEAKYKWIKRYEMVKTKIFYIKNHFLLEALQLERWLPGNQSIINYQRQKEDEYDPDLKYEMIGLENRDLVIFIGNDYRKIKNILE